MPEYLNELHDMHVQSAFLALHKPGLTVCLYHSSWTDCKTSVVLMESCNGHVLNCRVL